MCGANEKEVIVLFQCCMRDDSRSIAHAVQPECANHLKLLYSKDMVVSV
jgi:hypothetical protein